MRLVRWVFLLTALGLLATAVVLPLRGVRTPDGHFCGSAWHSARHEIVGGAGVSVTKVELSSACKAPGKKVMKQAAATGGAGLVLLLVVAAWPAGTRRGPGVPAARR